jgi:hypothetical protein
MAGCVVRLESGGAGANLTKQQHVRMDHDPGREIPVKDGHIVLESESDGAGSN